MISEQQQAFNKRKETIYSKKDFHTRIYGLASPDLIEYGITGELHVQLEERVGIKGAMQTTSALQEGWVRFSSRFGELEMNCIPSRTALRSIHNLVLNVKVEHWMLD